MTPKKIEKKTRKPRAPKTADPERVKTLQLKLDALDARHEERRGRLLAKIESAKNPQAARIAKLRAQLAKLEEAL